MESINIDNRCGGDGDGDGDDCGSPWKESKRFQIPQPSKLPPLTRDAGEAIGTKPLEEVSGGESQEEVQISAVLPKEEIEDGGALAQVRKDHDAHLI